MIFLKLCSRSRLKRISSGTCLTDLPLYKINITQSSKEQVQQLISMNERSVVVVLQECATNKNGEENCATEIPMNLFWCSSPWDIINKGSKLTEELLAVNKAAQAPQLNAIHSSYWTRLHILSHSLFVAFFCLTWLITLCDKIIITLLSASATATDGSALITVPQCSKWTRKKLHSGCY